MTTEAAATSALTICQDSVLALWPLVYRDSDDDPDCVVVGRMETGEFVELPAIGAAAVRLLGEGVPIGVAEQRIAADHDVELDLAELAEGLIELGFVAAVSGRPVADGANLPGSHLPWLREHHVRWLFSRTAALLWLGVVVATVVTWWRQPTLFVTAGDFFWSDYVGLTVLVNTALFSVAVSVHELMHLAAARRFGAPGRISFSTRLHHLVVQTDVSGAWAVPRGKRYVVYLAGLAWDAFVVCASTLLIAYAGLEPTVDRVLAALALCVLLSMLLQAQVYMRTDLYYVLMERLRCANLFHDGLAYARHLVRRATGRHSSDPTTELSARERRAVRVYAVAMVAGSAIALSSFAVYGLPILIEGILRAIAGLLAGLTQGAALRAVDSALIIAVEGTLQVIFLVTFYRRHRFRLRRSRPAGTPPAADLDRV
jgi:putative peptide zinc metalloprotease protein